MQDELNTIDDLFARQKLNDDTYWAARRKHLEDYYREAENLDVTAMAKELRTPTERFQHRMAGISEAESAGLFREHPELAGRARDAASEEARGALGIKNTMADYSKSRRELEQARPFLSREQYDRRRAELAGVERPEDSYRDEMKRLREARKVGDITPEEFERQRKRARREAVGRMTEDDRAAFQPTPAMAAGSREERETMVGSMFNAGRDADTRRASTKLDAIDAEHGRLQTPRMDSAPSRSDPNTAILNSVATKLDELRQTMAAAASSMESIDEKLTVVG